MSAMSAGRTITARQLLRGWATMEGPEASSRSLPGRYGVILYLSFGSAQRFLRRCQRKAFFYLPGTIHCRSRHGHRSSSASTKQRYLPTKLKMRHAGLRDLSGPPGEANQLRGCLSASGSPTQRLGASRMSRGSQGPCRRRHRILSSNSSHFLSKRSDCLLSPARHECAMSTWVAFGCCHPGSCCSKLCSTTRVPRGCVAMQK